MANIHALIMPIKPGKTELLKTMMTEWQTTRKADHLKARKEEGFTREVVWLAPTPMGDFGLVIVEAPNIQSVLPVLATSPSAHMAHFRAQVCEATGIDLAKDKPLPCELLFEWTDGDYSKCIPYAFFSPILPGKEQVSKDFAKSFMTTEKTGHVASRKAAGVHRECCFIITSPMGSMLFVFFEAVDPMKALQVVFGDVSAFGESTRKSLLENCGMDVTKPPPPPSQMMFSSTY